MSDTPEYESLNFIQILNNIREEPMDIEEEEDEEEEQDFFHHNQEGEVMDWFRNLPPNVEMSVDSGYDTVNTTRENSLSPDHQAPMPLIRIRLQPQPPMQQQHQQQQPHMDEDFGSSPDMFRTPTPPPLQQQQQQQQQQREDWGNDGFDNLLMMQMDIYEGWDDDYEDFNNNIAASTNRDIQEYL